MEVLVRGSSGLSLKRGITPDTQTDITKVQLNPKDAICRSIKFSNNGQYFGYCDSRRTVVIETTTGKELFSAELAKTSHILFSPRDRVMVTYEPYVIYGTRMNPDGTTKVPDPNLRFWSIPDGKLLATIKSDRQSMWRPLFTDDESIMLRLSGSEILFYENLQFERFTKSVVIKNMDSFEISPGPSPNVICFLPPLKGNPAIIQLRKVSHDTDLPLIGTKISFNCDKCTMQWNSRGTAAIAITTVDVDKSDKSYYGVSHIVCFNTKGDSSQIQLSKNGPLHDCKWSPTGKEFAVCYGFMPSKVTIFNLKGDEIWDLGEAHRNELYYNPFGNILTVCSFGNISSGKVQFFNVATRELIVQTEIPHTTAFEWAPDGQHFSTATTAPRLRLDNGYRIWHYTAKRLLEVSFEKEELWQVCWKPSKVYSKTEIAKLTETEKTTAANSVIKSSISKHPVDSLSVSGAIAKSGKYIPPSQRKQEHNKTNQQTSTKTPISENEKKLKNLQKKLNDIQDLKKKRSDGTKLEQNQLQKIESEELLRQQLDALQLEMSN
ncbi:eukaryotic translation initiation factor eIF2A domain-containing protein [Ditylenchus destructor]|nr:eukaryotic translation initiation factor eIF2A domain-containing protein [Ditylenchus destructor]